MTAPLDLAAIRARCAAATPGPWGRTTSNDAHWLREVRDVNGRGVAWCGHEEKQAHDDAAFIAAARQDVPALVEEVERLRDLLYNGGCCAEKPGTCTREGKSCRWCHESFCEQDTRADRDRLAAECDRLAEYPRKLALVCRENERLRPENDRLAAELERVSKERDDIDAMLQQCQADFGAVEFELDTLRAQLAAVEGERDEHRAMLCDLLASAHPVENPTMAAQWKRARTLLKDGTLRAAGKGDK